MSTFDPLGFLSFYTVAGNMILREVWRRDCRRDEQIPDDVKDIWDQWRRQMDNVSLFSIPQNLQLHIFVDSSQI